MEYIYIIITYNIIQNFYGIGLTVKANEQILIPGIFIIRFIQETIIYGSIKSPPDVGFCNTVLESIGIELNNKVHTMSILLFLFN